MNARRMLRVERRLNRRLWKALSRKYKRIEKLRRELARLDAVEVDGNFV